MLLGVAPQKGSVDFLSRNKSLFTANCVVSSQPQVLPQPCTMLHCILAACSRWKFKKKGVNTGGWAHAICQKARANDWGMPWYSSSQDFPHPKIRTGWQRPLSESFPWGNRDSSEKRSSLSVQDVCVFPILPLCVSPFRATVTHTLTSALVYWSAWGLLLTLFLSNPALEIH